MFEENNWSNHILTYEELQTVVIEIESTLHNRPLTYIYGDEEGGSRCLTPADLIYGNRLSSIYAKMRDSMISQAPANT